MPTAISARRIFKAGRALIVDADDAQASSGVIVSTGDRPA
jgi:hypothetical protein